VNDVSDQSLIARCLGGQTEAFGLLVERYQHRLYGALVAVSGSPEQARDIAQDAFVHAFEKLRTFRGESAFYSWLFRIALNVAISARRKNHRVTASIDAIREASTRSARPPDRIRKTCESRRRHGMICMFPIVSDWCRRR
jgi:RNA polymerase sigma-70 factor, ECF subfamily